VPGDTEEEIKRPTDHGGSMSQYIPDIKIMAYLAEGQQLEENRDEWLEFNMPGTIVTRRLGTWHLPSRRDADLTIRQWMATSLPTIYPMTPANENDIPNEAFESKWPFRIVSTAQNWQAADGGFGDAHYLGQDGRCAGELYGVQVLQEREVSCDIPSVL
jgi:hypothetical protein